LEWVIYWVNIPNGTPNHTPSRRCRTRRHRKYCLRSVFLFPGLLTNVRFCGVHCCPTSSGWTSNDDVDPVADLFCCRWNPLTVKTYSVPPYLNIRTQYSRTDRSNCHGLTFKSPLNSLVWILPSRIRLYSLSDTRNSLRKNLVYLKCMHIHTHTKYVRAWCVRI